MMKEKRTLMLPGPTPIPEQARLAAAEEIIGHREPECDELIEEVVNGLKYVFQTENDVLVLTCSGTGGLEASLANTLSAGDKVLSLCTGAFGERYATIAEKYGLDVERINFEWGTAVDVDKVRERLEEDEIGEIKAILMTHNETSTGVMNHPQAIGELATKHDTLLLVDAVSSLGGMEMKTDEWGIDVVVTSSQKALMTAPGLCLVSVSEKALKAGEDSDLPKFYWDFKRAKDRYDRDSQTPSTPAIATLYTLREVLKEIKDEGIENVFARHRIVTKAIRKAMEAIGLELLVDDEVASKTVTAVKVPEDIEYSTLRQKLKDDYNVYITGSKGKLKGKVFRIGHMGNVSRTDILSTISAIEMVLKEEGFKLELGIGLKSAQKVFYEEESS
ncbi:pyridoxal-phosphate-dependent aminotransferase family protein [Candidatus Frackibacter sp. WG13]|uniref:pyridoxal-phosphate-dependent aminotransferase family protein n=2 Tax=Candidatus Frackibacter TaxID=2017975 RepID=UPI00088667D4|nr:alanine--glyoxylate aminotransferase family protein [Candidatus Frackibacter sp. WG13]SDC53849.1 aspartate aminotransferase [Candidatus Frackibacter sp. WG11]SEM66146.1 aspartate aminotransferase [Candidatus Frackibacter sp. WG12]SFL77477.1 aspartate aminotransferase [Candidatus Frackibacter sp. WG13]